jgi:hypothetical protein
MPVNAPASRHVFRYPEAFGAHRPLEDVRRKQVITHRTPRLQLGLALPIWGTVAREPVSIVAVP